MAEILSGLRTLRVQGVNNNEASPGYVRFLVWPILTVSDPS